jgi:hypothetical protein
MRSSTNFVCDLKWLIWSTCFCFLSHKDSQKQALKSKTIWVTWMEITDTKNHGIREWLSRLENSHLLQHFLVTWLELKRPIHFLNSCARLEFWTFSQVENAGDFLELKRPTRLPNSYAQSEFWTFSWVKRMSMIFLSFKMTYPLS